MFYVYHLTDPRNGEVFYVGKGTRNRVDAHEGDARSGVDHPKCDVIRAIWADGFKVIKTRVKQFEDEAAAYRFEAEEIDRIGLVNLTNRVAGGGGARPWFQDRHTARNMLRTIAAYWQLKARGEALSAPWGQAADSAIGPILGRLRDSLGAAFVQEEMSRYGGRVSAA